MEEGLAARNLIGKSRTRFVSSVAAALYHEKAYPTKIEYGHVAERIVKKYSFMADHQGSHVSAKIITIACI